MQIVYNGQHDEVFVPIIDKVVQKGKPVGVGTPVAELLLHNPDWQQVSTKGKENLKEMK